MSWPMVHFAIAVDLYNNKPSPAFLLGSVGPDAVLVQKEPSALRAAKMRSHLVTVDKLPEVEDLIHFYKDHVTEETPEDFRHYLMGYISHIYTDGRWDELKKSLGDTMSGTTEPPRVVFVREENQLDKNLYRSMEWAQFVRSEVFASPVYEVPELYEKEELAQWRVQLYDFLDDPNTEPKIELQYITEEVASNFIREISAELQEIFYKHIG